MDRKSTILAFDSKECTGCAACAYVCPRKAISFRENKEGFLYPSVDPSLCISCKRCQKVCSANPAFSFPENQIKDGYIALSSSYSPESRSSSGGIADAFTQYALSQVGWVVVGCVMEPDGTVRHRLISDIDDAWLFQGSKYVQSDVTSGLLEECRDELDSGKKILFFGTPCQVHGMRLALPTYKDSIVGVDLICHGVPSPLFWKMAFERLKEDGFINEANDLLFRHRSYWERDDFSFLNKTNGKIKKNELNAYYSAFLTGSSFRESCYSCKFATSSRSGDITIGDCATVSKYLKFAPVESASTILVNTATGKEFLQGVFKQKRIKGVSLDCNAEIAANAQLHKPSSRPIRRDAIYRDLRSVSYAVFEKNYKTGLNAKKEVKNIIKRAVPLSVRSKMRLLLRGRSK